MYFSNNFVMLLQSTSSASDLAHQLYVLEQLLLNHYEERMNTSMDVNDQDATEKIKELRKVAFESDGEVNIICILEDKKKRKKCNIEIKLNVRRHSVYQRLEVEWQGTYHDTHSDKKNLEIIMELVV